MYSVSVEESATVHCFLASHDRAHLLKMNVYPVKECLPIRQFPQSESTNPLSGLESASKINPRLAVPFK